MRDSTATVVEIQDGVDNQLNEAKTRAKTRAKTHVKTHAEMHAETLSCKTHAIVLLHRTVIRVLS